MMGNDESIDYAEEGRKLLARVNLLEENENPQPSTARRRYSPASAIFKHPDTGATVYVGNYVAAGSMDQLNFLQTCRRIVFCQDGDGKKHFESNPEFQYLTFPIGRWRTLIANRTPESVAAFFQPLFEFLDAELGQGNSILIHCLAGAHRAGTAGIASLMHLTGMNAKDATKAAQALRPAINPIGDFPILLYLLETYFLETGMKKNNSE